jgi:hypothetical protein
MPALPLLELCLPLAPDGRCGLLLMTVMKRLDLVKHAQECRATAECVIALLPEVPGGSLAGFRVRDSAPRVPGQARQACLSEASCLPHRSEARTKIPVGLGDRLVHREVTPLSARRADVGNCQIRLSGIADTHGDGATSLP